LSLRLNLSRRSLDPTTNWLPLAGASFSPGALGRHPGFSSSITITLPF